MSANNYSKLNILGFQSWFNNYKATVASGEVPNPYGLTAAPAGPEPMITTLRKPGTGNQAT